MARIDLKPMPRSYLDIKPLFRPSHPPVFPDGRPTADDIEEAKALYKALDSESRGWYRCCFEDL